VRSRKGSHLQGGADRTGDQTLTNAVFHAMHVIISLKLGDHEGLPLLRPWPASEEDPACCPACDPDPDPDPCIPESSSCLLPSPVRDFLVLPGSCPSTQLQETKYQFCIFCFISLIINNVSNISVISKTLYIQFVSLSPFSSFLLPLVGGQGLTESVCHSVYCRPALKGDTDFAKTS